MKTLSIIEAKNPTLNAQKPKRQMEEKYNSLNKKEKVTTKPHYPNNLSLDATALVCHVVQNCELGTCDSCKRHCQIKQFRRKLKVLKPSFCPGDFRKCPRAKKLQSNGSGSCGRCRGKALDLSVKASEIVYPEEDYIAELIKMQAEEDYVKDLAEIYGLHTT